MGLYITDDVVGDLTRVCNFNIETGKSHPCDALQSSTWTPDAGIQHYRDPGIRGMGMLNGSAGRAMDASEPTCSQTWRERSPWWRVDLEVPRLVVSLHVYGRMDCCQGELEGFEVRVGNWPAWDKNAVCASDVSAPTDTSGKWVDCQAEGRYVFIVVPGINRSLSLCEVQVAGLPNRGSRAISGILPNCTSCIPGTFKHAVGSALCESCAAGKFSSTVAMESACLNCVGGEYQDEMASTTCKSCSWSWETQNWATVQEPFSSGQQEACRCNKGVSGSGGGLLQDTPSLRPVYNRNSSVGTLGRGGIVFSRALLQFMHARQGSWNIQSNDGLTIVAQVRFSGDAGMHERVVDFGSTVERYYDSFLLSRWQASNLLYAAITQKVCVIFDCISCHIGLYQTSSDLTYLNMYPS
jgi:hypothetical protein